MKTLWQQIKTGVRVVGDFQARLILTLFYAVLVLPTGLILKLGEDLLPALHPSTQHTTYWQKRGPDKSGLRVARGQG